MDLIYIHEREFDGARVPMLGNALWTNSAAKSTGITRYEINQDVTGITRLGSRDTWTIFI